MIENLVRCPLCPTKTSLSTGSSVKPSLLSTHQKGHWRHIDVLAELFKALGADRGRQTIAQARESLADAEKNNERIRLKLAKHDRGMGRVTGKRRGRPKGST